MSHIIAIATLESLSPLSFSRHYETPALEKEAARDYEERTWRERLHYDKETGECYIPANMLKGCLAAAAKYLSMKVSGKATYTKHFEAGVMCVENLMLGIQKDDVEPTPLFVPSDGRRGGGSRVMKIFPEIPRWSGDAKFLILDRIITEPVFEEHLIEAGNLIGMGRFRPRNNGTNGRFRLVKLEWHDKDREAEQRSRKPKVERAMVAV